MNVIESIQYKEKHANDNIGILNICKDFYNDLYTSRSASNEHVKNYIKNIPVKHTLSEEEKTNVKV